MTVKTIFFYENKFGIILNIEGEIADTYLEEGGISKINLKDLETRSLEIPSNYVTSILSNEIWNYFTYTTYDKGLDYYEKDKVEEFYLENNHITSLVNGNRKYIVTLSFDNRNNRCSCPVGFRCKHIVASLMQLGNICNKLLKKYVEIRNNYNPVFPLSSEINITTLEYERYFDLKKSEFIGIFPIEKLKQFDLEFNNTSDNQRLRFFEEVEYLLSKSEKKDIVRAYILHLRISKDLKKYSRLFLNKNKFKNLNSLFESLSIYLQFNLVFDESDIQHEINLYFNYVNGNYEKLIITYFLYFAKDTSHIYYLKYALDNYNNLEPFKLIRSLNLSDNIDKKNIELLLTKFDKNEQILLFKREPELLLNNDIKLSLNEIIDIIQSARYNLSVPLITKYKETLLEDPRKFVELLRSIYLTVNYKDGQKILKIAKSLPHSTYMVYLFSSRTYALESRVGEDESFSEKLDKYYKSINQEDLFYYLDLEYEVTKGTNLPQLKITLNLGNIPYVESCLENGKLTLLCSEGFYGNNLANFIYDYALDKYKSEIEDEKARIVEEIKKINKEKELAGFEDAFSRYSNESYRVIGASGEAKARLQTYLYIRNSSLDFEFKIGNVKNDTFYKIKSLEKLMYLFKRVETFKYGKNLTFTHRIENLVEPYNKLLEYFFKISYIDYYANIRISLNKSNIAPIFEILNNTYIYVNDKETLINLVPVKVEYSISKDYVAHLNYGKGLILELDDKKLIYNQETNEINLLDVDKLDNALFDFFKWSNEKSIEPVFDKFKDIVYSMNREKISIDESHKEQFKINDIDINAYFDYKNGKVYVETKISKDGIDLNIENIENPNDLSKYNTYLNYLNTLGFIDNCIEDEVDLINFFELDFTYLKSQANVYLSESISNKYVKKLGKMQLSIEKTNSMFEVFLDTSEYTDEELSKILKAIKRKRKFVLLEGDKIIKLDEEAVDLYQTLEDFNINLNKPKERVLVPTYEALKAYAHEANCKIDAYLANMIEEIKSYKDFNVELPKINASLRDYQVDGFKWLSVLKKYHIGGILADDMGLGKTLEIITLISADNASKPSLIVCPKSLVFNWMNEFKKFNPELKVSEIYGAASDRESIISSIEKDKNHVYVISYDSLSRDIEVIKNIDFKFVILDEAQTIKNVYAKKSVNVKLLKAEYRFALTGTPIENTVIDLWSLFDFLMPNFLEELSDFKSHYTNDENYTKRLAQKVALFILRRTKSDVLKDLPSKFERIVTCQMNISQRKLYDSLIMDANDKMSSGMKVFDILPYLMRLRQICIDPSLYIENSKETGAKLEELYFIINEYKETHKMIIFSQFVSALNIVKTHLEKNNISYFMITGDTDAKERLRLANEFNNDSTPIFLVSLKAGGTGLNLIGADTVIHIDPWWNLSAENQATDRAHRIGQKKNVEVIKLICENSIEQRVIELQNMKKDIIDKLIANDDSNMSKITLDDLSFILK